MAVGKSGYKVCKFLLTVRYIIVFIMAPNSHCCAYSDFRTSLSLLAGILHPTTPAGLLLFTSDQIPTIQIHLNRPLL